MTDFYRVTLYRVAGRERSVIPDIEYPSAATAIAWAEGKMGDPRYCGWTVERIERSGRGAMVGDLVASGSSGASAN